MQLRHTGRSKATIEGWGAGLRVLHDGVYLTGWGAVTQRQRWWSAVLTAPGTVLANASAGGLFTTAERTIIDLWPHLAPAERVRMLREALRLRRTTTTRMLAALHAHRGRRGVESLRTEVVLLGGLRLERCRSDAEAFAVALLHDAGIDAPDVNEPIAGRRADLSWPAHRLIIEIDGPSFHVLRDADIATMRRWEGAGYTVRRIPSDVLYADPSTLLRLAPPARPNVPICRL